MYSSLRKQILAVHGEDHWHMLQHQFWRREIRQLHTASISLRRMLCCYHNILLRQRHSSISGLRYIEVQGCRYTFSVGTSGQGDHRCCNNGGLPTAFSTFDEW